MRGAERAVIGAEAGDRQLREEVSQGWFSGQAPKCPRGGWGGLAGSELPPSHCWRARPESGITSWAGIISGWGQTSSGAGESHQSGFAQVSGRGVRDHCRRGMEVEGSACTGVPFSKNGISGCCNTGGSALLPICDLLSTRSRVTNCAPILHLCPLQVYTKRRYH